MATHRGLDRLDRLQRTARGIADDVLVLRPSAARTPRAWLRQAVDRLAGADPGLTQLRRALVAVLGIALGVGLVDAFTAMTGALQWPASMGTPDVVAQHNHAVLIVSMLIAGMVAMMAGLSVTESTAKGQLASTLILPVPMAGALVLGLATGRSQLASYVFLVLLLTTAVYVRRWGPRPGSWGLVAFNGGFLGFFLHAELGLGDVGWLLADLAIGALASLAVRFTLVRPDPERGLERMRHSWEARAQHLLALCEQVLAADTEARRETIQERLRRQMVRLNESTLMMDAQLVESLPTVAAQYAQRLFDTELAVSNCARFSAAIAANVDDAEARRLCRAALRAAVHDRAITTSSGTPRPAAAIEQATARLRGWHGRTERATVLLHRLGASIERYASAHRTWRLPITEPDDEQTSPFRPAVALTGGYLPGSGAVSAAASSTPGRRGRLLDRQAMPPHLRAAIQIAVAATLAIVVGGWVSGSRLYWAVLATFLAFMATANAGEQLRKALFRVAGTAIGIVIGDLLVRVTGANVWASFVIVLIALFFGIYLLRVNYTFMVIGITVTMSQLYAQLGEFSWNLLVLRLGETAIGVGAVVVTVLVIVPLRPQRVLTTAVLGWFSSLQAVLDAALDRLTGRGSGPLYPTVRELDVAYAALEATAAPLRTATFGRNSTQLTDIRSVSAAARNYVRSLARQCERARPLDDPAMRAAAAQLRRSTATIAARIGDGTHGTYTRTSALIEVASRSVPADDPAAGLALRDLTALDGALARLARALQMQVDDLDTGDAAPVATSTVTE